VGNSTVKDDDLNLILDSLSAAGEAAYVWDVENDDIRWLGDIRAILQQDAGERTIENGRDLTMLINPQDLPERMQEQRHYRELAAQGEVGLVFDTEYRIRRADGEQQWVHERAQFHSTDDGLRMSATIRVVEKRQSDFHSLERLAFYDDLTGQHNRTSIQLSMDGAIESALHQGREGSFLAIGIDRLSYINEAFGPSTADAIIIGVGNRLQRLVGEDGTVARLAGDVYGIMFQDTPGGAMGALATHIIRAVADKPFSSPSGPQRISVSVGGAVFPRDSRRALDIITRAESALQHAKDLGRGCFMPYRVEENTRETYRKWLKTGDDFLLAANSGRLMLAYQPVIDARSDTAFFHECLMRMIGPNGEYLEASTFIPAVEQLGLTRLVDQFTVRHAIEELKTYETLTLSVNISAQTISDRSWLRKLVAQLQSNPDVASRLIIEITESVAMTDIEQASRFVKTLQDMGCRVALDDFGVGQTSFAHLRSLGVDIVKIDKSFIRNMGDDDDNLLFVRTLKALADGFNLDTVGEGAETLSERAMLHGDGVNYIQGYVHGLPSAERLWLPESHAQRVPDALRPLLRKIKDKAV